ncbi:MAG: molybdopterin-synthase adenylyltransferase MoeB [Gammaproteobacteria bacterium]|jgi:molybdopterin-synthase adenylyltransferase|nr:molybdopterin-synthase adenylyltransferase MoeB [Gammaproteobacteria bacterium]
MNDDQLIRYGRQIMLPDFDVAGQNSLAEAHVLIVGVGGLGSPAALYLAAAGVGRLTLCDHDTVDLSNLQRQIVHATGDIGRNKAHSGKETLAAINPNVTVHVIDQQISEALLQHQLKQVTLVLDCTDNVATRYMINEACWSASVPLVSGAAIGWEGQISVFDARVKDAPCYRCLYPNTSGESTLDCATNGVIAPLVGTIGAVQALEAIKLIANVGQPLTGHVLYFDAKYMEWRKLKLSRRTQCPVCCDAV